MFEKYHKNIFITNFQISNSLAYLGKKISEENHFYSVNCVWFSVSNMRLKVSRRAVSVIDLNLTRNQIEGQKLFALVSTTINFLTLLVAFCINIVILKHL